MKLRNLTALAAISMFAAGCGGGGSGTETSASGGDASPNELVELSLASCDPDLHTFSVQIDHPVLPMPEGRQLVLQGDEEGELIRLEIDVLDRFEAVGGVMTRVVAETEYKDGELFERTYNYFAQSDTGTVCYFGEAVEFFENGEVVNRQGSWRAEQGNKPGIQMPATPTVNTRFAQENAPGQAEDQSAIKAVDASVQTPLGAFENVVEMIDWNPLDGQTVAEGEVKRYAPAVGLVTDQEIELVAMRAELTPLDLAACDPAVQSFTLNINNPFFPLPVGRRLTLEDVDEGDQIRLEIEVPDQVETVAGVGTRVVTETEFINGELFERTFNYFAQTLNGDVCYFGEDVEFYENGALVDRRGSWRAGQNGSKPGIQMPAQPVALTQYAQEVAPGVAEDKTLIEAINQSVSTPAGEYAGSVLTMDWNPLDGDSFLDAEPKAYAPGVGLIQDNLLRLTVMQ